MLKAKKIETKTEIHDDILIDNYRWMEDLENNKSEIMEYVKAENDFTNESLKHTEEVQKKLLKEFSSRVITGEQILYNEIDEYLYYHRKVEGEKLKNYYRKKGENGLEELVLDLNKVDGGNNYCSIHDLEISPDHKFIAYAIDKDGSEMCELFIQ
jgi:oligopeptidase B